MASDDALSHLCGLAAAYRIGLDDACVAVRDQDGQLHLKQVIGDRITESLPRRFWRDIVGHILQHGHADAPTEGSTPGVGLDCRFAHEVASSLEPESSALLMVVEAGAPSDLAAALKARNARLLKAVLPKGKRSALADALEPLPEHVPAATELRVLTDAARRGETEAVAYRFPSDVCTDGGRASNSREPGWPNSLAGQPKALYEYWNSTLRPAGYRLSAEIPDGMPDNVGFRFDWSDPGRIGR